MNMRRALAASIGVAERWMTKRNVHCSAWLHSLCCVVSDDGVNKGAENGKRPVVGKTTHTRTWHPGQPVRHNCWFQRSRSPIARHKSYALWLATCYNKSWLSAHTTRRLLSWSVQQHTNVLASLRPAYISRLTPKCRMICRLTPKSCVQSANVR